MQGPWIKAYAALEVHRKTARMAVSLGCIPASVIGGIMSVWWMADREATPDGFLSGVTREDIDAKVRIPGFAAAMELVGWLVVQHDGVQFPEFDKHMGQKHRERSREKMKKRRQRARKPSPHSVPTMSPGDTTGTPGDCPPSVPKMSPQTETKTSVKSGAPNPSGSTHLGAREGALDSPAPKPAKKAASKAKKRPAFDWREDLKATEFAALAQHPGFVEAWDEWLAYRREARLGLPVQRTWKSAWRKWKADPAGCIEAIEHSIRESYHGIYAPKSPQSAPAALHGHSGKMNAADAAAVWRAQRAAQGAAESQPRDVDLEPDSPFRLLGGAKQ